ncbi:MAG: CinA family protein [Clostridia bacterium]|nr:CinA family protein [Clostridia bacterium]
MRETFKITKDIGEILIKGKKSIALAESCTGGLIASLITDVPGSSKYFGYGIISYSNEAKTKLLGVKKDTLRDYGAVSKETAQEMALGVRKISSSDYGLSVTGIAGPGGGSSDKPIGLVYVGFSSNKGESCQRLDLEGNRQEIRLKTADLALNYLLEKIDEVE